jgi:hypothetical protein
LIININFNYEYIINIKNIELREKMTFII